MRPAGVTLPPLVEGPVRGLLRLSIGAVSWSGSRPPVHPEEQLQARIAWWGDASGGEVLPLPGGAAADAAAAAFQLRTGPKYFTRYMRDMGCLSITVEAAGRGGRAAAAVATASVGLLALDVQAPISGSYPLVLAAPAHPAAAAAAGCSSEAIVGSLLVRLELDYGGGGGIGGSDPAALLTSFELNEHLASISTCGAGAVSDADKTDGAAPPLKEAAADEPPTALGGPSVCTRLASVLQDRELVAGAVEQIACISADAASQQGREQELDQQGWQQLLRLLLPTASQHQLEYAAAMLLPFVGCRAADQVQQARLSLPDLQAAAANCCAVERRLQQLPAAESTRSLRPLAFALGSRSLDLAAAFVAAEEEVLPYAELGTLLQRLHPAASADDARCLLALLAAADGRSACAGNHPGAGITLPAIKAALTAIQDAQQFPTADDSERQQAATAARRAKESAAAAAAVVTEQRAAAGAAARAAPPQQAPGRERKMAVVSRLKSQQQRRRSGIEDGGSGGSQQSEVPVVEPAPQQVEVLPRQQPSAQVPAVVVGIPVLPPPVPPPCQPSHLGLPGGAAASPASATTAGPAKMIDVSAVQPSAVEAAPNAGQAVTAAPRAFAASCQHVAQGTCPQQQGPVLQLIQQAEQLKAALEQAAGSGSWGRHGTHASSPLADVAGSMAAAPRLSNLLIPPFPGPSAADGSLSAATAALVAAAKALRLEGERDLPKHHHVPTASDASAARGAPQDTAPTTASSALDSSDPESDAEDALLESLFFRQQHQPLLASAAACTSMLKADDLACQQQHVAASQHLEQQQQHVLRVQLLPAEVSGSGSCGSSVRCVIKPMCGSGHPQQLSLPLAASGTAGSDSAAACYAEVPMPATAGSVGAPGLQQQGGMPVPAVPPYLFLELWRHSGSLLGVVKVPLLQPSWCATAGSPPSADAGSKGASFQPCSSGQPPVRLPAVVAEGRHAISDILEGREAGSLYVAAVLQERGSPPLAPAVRHRFGVRIRSAHRLPSAAAYAGAGLRAPDGRLLRYSFPGEPDALQTKEVPCCSNPCFEATAQHEMVLPATQSILPLLQDGLLRFELLDCWADQPQQRRRQQHGWALLPLAELAGLAGEAERSSGGAREASRVLLLPLCTEYDSPAEAAAAAAASGGGGAAQAAAAAAATRGPSLKIELSYAAQLCTTPVAEAAAAAVAGTGGDAAPPAAAKKAGHAAGAFDSGSGADSDGENSLVAANSGSARRRVRNQGQQPQVAAASSSTTPAAFRGHAAAAAPVAEPLEPFVPATLMVEIIRACGLAGAVREAAATLSGSGSDRASSLARAASVGPHAFARLALFAEESELQASAPPLQTPFIPQSFCPTWQAAHSYQLHLTSRMLNTLATQSVRVEVWHRCPRGGAAGASGQRELLLGTGSAPLLDVLRKQQGLRCWVPLTPGISSRRASSSTVGAVQIAVRLAELGSLAAAGRPGGKEALLLRCAEAAALLPPALHTSLLQPPGADFVGQAAVVAVRLDLLLPPSSASSTRPKADRYYCRYSLSGSLASNVTAARVLTAVGGASSFPSRSSKSSGGSTGLGQTASGEQGKQRQTWGAKLNHRGFFEVRAGPALVAALLHAPLHVHVYKQPAASSSSSSATAPAASRPGVLVGRADVDLSPLLWSGSSSSAVNGPDSSAEQGLEEKRRVSGLYPLVEGAAASQGGASLAATVQLQLLPLATAAAQAAAAAAAGADACCAAWLLEGSGGDQMQPTEGRHLGSASSASSCDSEEEAANLGRQQGHFSPEPQRQQHKVELDASSSDDEELLQRCHLLVAGSAARSNSPSTLPKATAVQRQQKEQQPADAREGQPGQDAQQAAAGSAGGCAASQPPSLPPAQQVQQEGGAGAAPGSEEPAATVREQGEQAQVSEPEGSLLVQIETALHLPATASPASIIGPASGEAGSDHYRSFVQAVWGPQRQVRQRTPAVPVHVLEAADLGGTAVWGSAELELPATAVSWAASSGNGSRSGDGPTLLLNVWTTRASASSSASGSTSAAASDSLIGTAAVDLSLLPSLGSLAGWFHIVGSDQQQRGQIKAAVRANSTLRSQLLQAGLVAAAAPSETASAPSAASPAAAAAGEALASAALPAEQQIEPKQVGLNLMQQLQVQLNELDLLSQRLASEPPSAHAAAAGAQLPSPAASSTASAQRPQQPQGAAQVVAAAAGAYELAESEGEEDAWPPFDARQMGNAWSGSHSDADIPLDLVDVAFEGAVSPGYSDDEAEEQRPRAASRPALLLDDDWMFSISRAPQPAADQAAAAEGTGAAAGVAGSSREEEALEEQELQQPRCSIVFRNVIAQGGATMPPSSALPRVATAPASRPPLPVVQLPPPRQEQQEQQPASSPPALPTRLPSLAGDWMFGIRRPQQPAASSSDGWGAEVAPAEPAPECGQFAPMQQLGQAASVPALSGRQQRQGQSAGAATIDEVLEQLQHGRTTAPGSSTAASG